jgi:hypothetical protein
MNRSESFRGIFNPSSNHPPPAARRRRCYTFNIALKRSCHQERLLRPRPLHFARVICVWVQLVLAWLLPKMFLCADCHKRD